MINKDCEHFRWDELLKRIQRKNVIPVIGQGLYRIGSNDEPNNDISLYDFLAEKVAGSCGVTPNPEENHKFAKACLEFLKKNKQYLILSEFLKKTMKEVHMAPENPLKKLACVKAFDIFITSAYDDFLADTIKTVRAVPTETFCYTIMEKHLYLMDSVLFKLLENSGCTMVYHMLGHVKNMDPAYTEKDILETLLDFKKDMETNAQHSLFQKLKSSSFLFIGCGFDDWLFRFFIRSLSNGPYEFKAESQTRKFVGEDFATNKKDPFLELPRFLKDHHAEVFYTCGGNDFVDLLLKKLEKNKPDLIIQPWEFPAQVFISFEGKDRKAARQLAANLREDGIDVWQDERRLQPGDEVDETIIKAIDKCPVFLALISKHSQCIHTEKGKLKYHCREWERAYTNLKADDKNKQAAIIPVIIDKTDWLYDKFKNFFCVKVPGGKRTGDYNKLIRHLRELLKQ